MQIQSILSDYPYLVVNHTDLLKMSDKNWKKLIAIDSRFSTIQNEMRLKKLTK